MTDKNLLRIGFFGVFLGCLISFSACGSDSSSSADGDFFSSNSQGDDSAASNDGSSQSGDADDSSTSTVNSNGSSNKKNETVSSNEALMEAKKVVKGTCGPSPEEIDKGDIVTWEFYRSEGKVFDQIVAPFVWTLSGASKETLQGNGLNSVNVRYTNSGKYTAKLSVDGNEVECDPLRVQGVPITVKACKATSGASANAGETISWEVDAESESKITEYSWKSSDGEVKFDGKKATMVATGEMHKKSVKATVSITNADKTTVDYTCEPVTVIDPNQVDIVIAYSNPDKTKSFTAGETLVAQYPPNAVNCDLQCTSDGDGTILEVNGVEYVIGYSKGITPDNCTNGSAAGTKISVKASMLINCYVTY